VNLATMKSTMKPSRFALVLAALSALSVLSVVHAANCGCDCTVGTPTCDVSNLAHLVDVDSTGVASGSACGVTITAGVFAGSFITTKCSTAGAFGTRSMTTGTLTEITGEVKVYTYDDYTTHPGGSFDMPLVTTVGGAITISSTTLTGFTAPVLATASSLSLTWNELAGGSAAAIEFPALTTLTGGGLTYAPSPFPGQFVMTSAVGPFSLKLNALTDCGGNVNTLLSTGSVRPLTALTVELNSIQTILGTLSVDSTVDVTSLKNISSNFYRFDDTAFNFPNLEEVGGRLEIRNTALSSVNAPKLAFVGRTIGIQGGSSATISSIDFPALVSVGYTHAGVPDGTSSGTQSIEISQVNSLTTFKVAALQKLEYSMSVTSSALNEVHINSLTTYSGSGQRGFQSAQYTAANGLTVYMPCDTNLLMWDGLDQYMNSPTYYTPSGCSFGSAPAGTPPSGTPPSGTPPSGTPPPSATTVTSAQLTAAVAACFAESASGACQCASGCGVLSGPISSWSFTGTQLDLTSLFEAKTTFNQPIESWDVSAVTSMSRMFRNASSFNQPLAAWNTVSVNDMTQMFAGATVFARDISSWDTSQVSAYTDMFDGATAFNAKYTCDGPKCSGDPSTGLSQAQKAGIAVGCVVFGIALIVAFIMKRRRDARENLRAQLGISPAGTPQYAPQQQPQVIVIQQS